MWSRNTDHKFSLWTGWYSVPFNASLITVDFITSISLALQGEYRERGNPEKERRKRKKKKKRKEYQVHSIIWTLTLTNHEGSDRYLIQSSQTLSNIAPLSSKQWWMVDFSFGGAALTAASPPPGKTAASHTSHNPPPPRTVVWHWHQPPLPRHLPNLGMACCGVLSSSPGMGCGQWLRCLLLPQPCVFFLFFQS